MSNNRYRLAHYIEFAAAIKTAKQRAATMVVNTTFQCVSQNSELVRTAVLFGIAETQNELIKLFAADNPKFNKLLFIGECGTGHE